MGRRVFETASIMAGEEVEWTPQAGSNATTTGMGPLLNAVQFHYPWVLAVVFLSAFVANSVLTAEPSSGSQLPTITGPGGKPLPRSAAKYKEELAKMEEHEGFQSRAQDTVLVSSCGPTCHISCPWNHGGGSCFGGKRCWMVVR